jgi:hypothetical protein
MGTRGKRKGKFLAPASYLYLPPSELLNSYKDAACNVSTF